MSVRAMMRMLLAARETFADALSVSSTLAHDAWSFGAGETPFVLSANSDVRADAVAVGEYTLSGDLATIDLTAAKHVQGTTKDLTGYSLVAIIVKAPSTNGAAITMGLPGDENYTALGNSFSMKFSPGDSFCKYLGDTGTTVSVDASLFALAGTGSTDKLQIVFLMAAPLTHTLTLTVVDGSETITQTVTRTGTAEMSLDYTLGGDTSFSFNEAIDPSKIKMIVVQGTNSFYWETAGSGADEFDMVAQRALVWWSGSPLPTPFAGTTSWSGIGETFINAGPDGIVPTAPVNVSFRVLYDR